MLGDNQPRALQISDISERALLWIYPEAEKLSWKDNEYETLVVFLLQQIQFSGNKENLEMRLSLLTGGRSSSDVIKLIFSDTSYPEVSKDILVIRSHSTKEQANKEIKNAEVLRSNTLDCFANIIKGDQIDLPNRYLVIYQDIATTVTGKETSELCKVLSEFLSSHELEREPFSPESVKLLMKQATKAYESIKHSHQSQLILTYYQHIASQLPPNFVVRKGTYFLFDIDNSITPKFNTISIKEFYKNIDIKEEMNWFKLKEKLYWKSEEILDGKGKTVYLSFLMKIDNQDISIWLEVDKNEVDTIKGRFLPNKFYTLIFKENIKFNNRMERIGFSTDGCILPIDFRESCKKKYKHWLKIADRHNDLHCGNVLVSDGHLKIIDIGDMKEDLIASDIARLEVSLWFETTAGLSREEALEVLDNLSNDENQWNKRSFKSYTLSLILHKLKKGFEEGIAAASEQLNENEIELAYVIQILLYQRYCLLDGLNKISEAFNVFACHWINRFRNNGSLEEIKNPTTNGEKLLNHNNKLEVNPAQNKPTIEDKQTTEEFIEKSIDWEKLLIKDPVNKDKSNQVQGLMLFSAALADGLELTIGQSCFQAGKKVGLEFKIENKEQDIFSALKVVRQEMKKMKIDWPVIKYKSVVQFENHQEVQLIVKNCIVRCALFRYGSFLGTPLCQVRHSLFCGLFEKIYGARRTYLDIFERGKHNAGAGENACLLTLKIYD